MFSCLLGLHNLCSWVFFMGFSGKNIKLIFHFSLMFRLRSHEAFFCYVASCRLEKFTAVWEEYAASFFYPVASIDCTGISLSLLFWFYVSVHCSHADIYKNYILPKPLSI